MAPVFLYSNMGNLPYGGTPKQPIAVLDPGEMQNFSALDRFDIWNGNIESQIVRNHWIWPLMLGAYLVETKDRAFHLPVLIKDKKFLIRDKLCIQVTSAPSPGSPNVMPLIVNNGMASVDFVFEICNPYGLVEDVKKLRSWPLLRQAKYWRNFFLNFSNRAISFKKYSLQAV